jgi:hypothetical protein
MITQASVANHIAEHDLPAIGAQLAGGVFAGRIAQDGIHYALIASPAAGDLKGAWSKAVSNVAGATSRVDGLANTRAMAAAGSELATAVLNLTINGFTDWYIPARDELELLYRHLKPSDQENYACYDGENENSVPPGAEYTEGSPVQTTVAAFRAGAPDALAQTWYWSSTQHAAYPSDAWGQGFSDGGQSSLRKSYEGRARAVRRVPIQSFDNSTAEKPAEPAAPGINVDDLTSAILACAQANSQADIDVMHRATTFACHLSGMLRALDQHAAVAAMRTMLDLPQDPPLATTETAPC